MLKQRVITALVLASFFVALLFFSSPVVFAAGMGIILLLGAWEWAALAGCNDTLPRIGYMVLVALLMLGLWHYHGDMDLPRLVLAIGLGWWLISLAWLTRPNVASTKNRLNRMLKGMTGLAVLVPAWLAIVILHGYALPNGHSGAELVLYLFTLVWLADIGAYFSGRRFGRVKLAPKVSPGKTREGALGALMVSALWSAVIGGYFDFSGTMFVLFIGLSILVAAISIVGDLIESIMKRHAGVKDSGNLLPGHGGVMDRIDSITAAAPVFTVGMLWVVVV